MTWRSLMTSVNLKWSKHSCSCAELHITCDWGSSDRGTRVERQPRRYHTTSVACCCIRHNTRPLCSKHQLLAFEARRRYTSSRFALVHISLPYSLSRTPPAESKENRRFCGGRGSGATTDWRSVTKKVVWLERFMCSAESAQILVPFKNSIFMTWPQWSCHSSVSRGCAFGCTARQIVRMSLVSGGAGGRSGGATGSSRSHSQVR